MLRRLVVFFFLLAISIIILGNSYQVRQLLLTTGIVQEEVSIAGTGSMYPTFPKGEGESDVIRAQEIVAWPKMRRYPNGINILGTNFFGHKIAYGDIVEFENDKTREITREKYGQEAGFVKRAVALPGDKIELRDGFVYKNGEVLDEPYIARARSSYGGDFLPDCKDLTIPTDYLFVLGDNRKASLDSRYELGLVKISDIAYVLPWLDQEEYKSLWRDSSRDKSLAHKVTLDGVEFVNLVNKKRTEKNLKPLNFQPQLSNSSSIRGDIMILSNDFSTEASRSGVTLAQAVKKANYNNIIFAEIFTRGFYEADELLDNFLEFPETEKILYSQKYQDIGVSAVLGEIDSCPVQVVVAHLGGYVPPNYKSEEINSWVSLVENLEKILPTWRSANEASGVDQNKLDKLLNLLDTRLNNARKIVTRMSANQWFTEQEKDMIADDKRLSEEASKLISELNSQ